MGGPGLVLRRTHPKVRGFPLVGFTSFIAITAAVIVFYNLFSDKLIAWASAVSPWAAFYATMLLGVAIAIGGYLIWLIRSLRSYRAFSTVLSRGGLDPHRPTAGGLRAYSDEQLLALRSRYERLHQGKLRERLGRTFGFYRDDEFSLGPLSVLPGTFEMGALRVEWETRLILRSSEPMPGSPGGPRGVTTSYRAGPTRPASSSTPSATRATRCAS